MNPTPNDSRKSIRPDRPDRPPGIQEEKPLAPWERPGYFRLDCQPHRGELLRWLGFLSLFGGSCFLLPGAALAMAIRTTLFLVVTRYLHLRLTDLVLVGSAVDQVLAGWVFLAARHDLREMAVGRKDPAGEDLTRRGRSSAAVAFLLAAACAAAALASMRW